jgi:SAM-dependent methyltransferase
MVLNFINNNFFSSLHSRKLLVQEFPNCITESDWSRVEEKSSPSRTLSDLFWMKLDWNIILRELKSLHVFDTGCGSGKYALKLQDFSDQKISSYYGVDCSSRNGWLNLMRENNYVTLKQDSSNNIMIPDKVNFFMSQSAIEHFEDDILYFEKIKKYIDKTKKNTVQVHLFPSAACLKLYLLHGVRQYNERSVSNISKIFDTSKSYSVLFKLGGRQANKLHFDFITKPLILKKTDRRETETKRYRELLKEAIEHDAKMSSNSSPSFYALVIHSNYENKIFN